MHADEVVSCIDSETDWQILRDGLARGRDTPHTQRLTQRVNPRQHLSAYPLTESYKD